MDLLIICYNRSETEGTTFMLDFPRFRHMFKLDPDKPISDEDLEAICFSGTDAIVVGGTQNIRYEDVAALLSRLRRYTCPVVLEVSDQKAIVPGFDHYFIPFVLNAEDPEWFLKPHVRAIQTFGGLIPWDQLSAVGYLVLNPDSAVARLTQCRIPLSDDEVLAYGRLAAHLLKLPFFYLEYSGTFGDVQLVEKVGTQLKKESGIHLLYGGGITSSQEAQAMLKGADTIVVGNIIYDDVAKALQTVPPRKAGGDGV